MLRAIIWLTESTLFLARIPWMLSGAWNNSFQQELPGKCAIEIWKTDSLEEPEKLMAEYLPNCRPCYWFLGKMSGIVNDSGER